MTTDSRAVFRGYLDAMAANDATQLRACITPDFTMRTPFSPEGFPTLCRGAENFIAQQDAVFGPIEHFKWFDIDAHLGQEPGLLFGTARSEVRLKSGKLYTNDYCFIARICDGRVAEHTEYFNPLRIMAAFG